MPRAKKTLAGTQGQPAQPITGQTYGEAKTQQMLQRTMPAPAAPQLKATTAPAQTQTQPQPTTRTPQDIVAMLQGQGGVLSAPDDKPNVPITDGLETGPGRGPEAFSTRSPLKSTIESLAMQTGDPIFYQLAAKLGR
jgi:hypothetical protein